MKNVIVIGANGFIGKTLVNALLEKGYHMQVLFPAWTWRC